MGNATLDGEPFVHDPSSARFTFHAKVSDQPTVGGKVIQVFGTKLTDLILTGEFGRAGWQAQQAFLIRMKKLASTIADNPELSAVRFLYPAKDWDFHVYLGGYDPVEGERSVRLSAGIINPRWKLRLIIVRDNSEVLTKAAEALFIERISQGMGWKPTGYSGPLTWATVEDYAGDMNLRDYLTLRFPIGTPE